MSMMKKISIKNAITRLQEETDPTVLKRMPSLIRWAIEADCKVGSYYDYTRKVETLEIVDCNGNPVFQLSVIPYEQWKEQTTRVNDVFSVAREVIQFYYICGEGETWWCVTPKGSQRVDNRASMVEWQRKIPRLFQYPGHQCPGIRLENRSR